MSECYDYMDFVDYWITLSGSCSDMRMLFLGRVTTAAMLKSMVPPDTQFALPKDNISDDIRCWLEFEIQKLFARGILPRSAQQEAPSLIDHLIKGADGMFLWARLMIDFLRSPCMTSAQRMDIIRQINVPEGLDGLYTRIFRFIDKSGPTARSLATRTIAWTAHGIVPLTSKQLHQALVADGCLQPSKQEINIEEFEDTVLVACAGLVERSGRCFRFSHLSVKEFIQTSPEVRPLGSLLMPSSQESARIAILPDPITVHSQLTQCCLRQLLHHTPNSPLCGQLSAHLTAKQLSERFPFTDYAAVYWMAHIGLSPPLETKSLDNKQSISSLSELASSLSVFLSSPRTASVWLESFYTADRAWNVETSRKQDDPPLQIFLGWLRRMELLCRARILTIPDNTLDSARRFFTSTENIITTWGYRLRQSPPIVWDEMTGFCPSPFFFSPDSVKMSVISPEVPVEMSTVGDHLFLISRTSNDGLRAVLRLWPSRLFRDDQYLNKIQSAPHLTSSICVRTGWRFMRFLNCKKRRTA
ncbi:hypothetical protein B0T16DRAFT_141111 [Cercophora newfieldiana]|uniref:Uncharacterized protein n=1 Tax=Cercophora newfieldiana TaxID=92897 RepID=A0AA39Y6Q0_9PEZI|nr:hypothetical protein B0T16DRAFT_141111 [Cercophora newfieldiana]